MNQENKKELLTQTAIPLEVRAQENEPTKIVGYASVFNDITDLFYYKERVAPGAFSQTLKDNPDVLALWDHETSMPIGRVAAGTLVLSEDDKGLRSEITPPDTTMGRDALELVRTGHVSGMSFGFRVLQDEWTKYDGKDLRTIKEVELFEVSVVTFPAYESTSAQARKLAPSLSKRFFDPAEVYGTFTDMNIKRLHQRINNRIAWLEKTV